MDTDTDTHVIVSTLTEYIVALFVLVVLFFLLQILFGVKLESFLSHKVTIPLPAYVINLAERRDRWERFLRPVLVHARENIIRVDAVNAKRLDKNSIRFGVYSIPVNRALTRGEIACFLSHMTAWKQIVDAKNEIVFVMEDDANLGDPEAADLTMIIEKCVFPDEWDVLFLGTNHSIPRDRVSNCFLGVSDGVFGSHCYLITRAAAKRLLALAISGGIHVPIDIFLSSPGCRFYRLDSRQIRQFDTSDTDTRVI